MGTDPVSGDPGTPGDPGQGGGGDEGNLVQLSRADYDNLIGEMTGLKLKVGEFEGKAAKDEAARREAETRAAAEKQARDQKPINFDQMTKADFANFILHQVNQHMVQPMLGMIMTNALKDEIREVAGRFDDFWNYKDEVYELTANNPQLTVEKAYKLAKAENPDKGKKTETSTVPKPTPVGERPGPPRGQVFHQSAPVTPRAAAQKAFEDLAKELPD